MAHTLEEAIAVAQALPPEDRRRLREWLQEHEHLDGAEQQKKEALRLKEERFRRALQWLAKHRVEYIGQWVALDGERLLSHGADGREVYAAARATGVEVPLLHYVSENEDKPFGGWIA